jgi:protease-4
MGIKQVLSPVGRFIARAWGWVDGSRRFVFNLIWLAILIALVSALFTSGDKLQDKTTLVLGLEGRLVEQRSGSSTDRLATELQGGDASQTQLRDVLKALDAAANDPHITQVLLDFSKFGGGGQASLREVSAALEQFKKSGKKVLAYADAYDQRSYQLAAHAHEVYMHPMGMVMLEGFGRYRNYYKDLFERVGLEANVVRAGKYKNFGEPYFANGPSPATLESESYLYGDLWTRYMTGVEAARKLPAGSITAYIDTLPQRMSELKGDTAKLALDAKLVDGLKERDEVRALLIERGAKDEKGNSYRRIGLDAYVAQLKPELPAAKQVAIVVAEGNIVDGSANPGTIGGDSTAALVRQARENDKVAAVVLRVNSPGGSAFASELIRRELDLTRKAGKPVVVSMGDVAASGGYWVSMSADEVIADASTITGSIGVFGMLPNATKALEKISLHTGGYGTTWLVGAGDPRLPLDPRVKQAVQAGIDRVYIDFTTRAAAARKTTPEAIDAVAQGRVWTGQQALDRKLVDRLGSLGDAVASAAKKAKLDGTPSVTYVEKERSKAEKLVASLFDAHAPAAGAWLRSALGLPSLPAPVTEAQRELGWLMQVNARSTLPAAAHVHCLCTAP